MTIPFTSPRKSDIARATGALVLLIAVQFTNPGARAQELASPWVEGFNNRVRLIAGQASGGPNGAAAQTYAGIEIVMPPGWKTYWRNPGEAGGVPPEFDFSGSENMEAPAVLYPAPHRLFDPKAGTNIGYKEHVIFPVAVVSKDTSKPASIKLKVFYGVCKDICVPAEVELSLAVPAGLGQSQPADSVGMTLVGAVRSVPSMSRDRVSTRAGEIQTGGSFDPATDPVLKAWHLEGTKLSIETNDPAGKDTDAFLFSKDGIFMPVPKKVSEEASKSAFEAELSEGAKPEELKGKSISVTIVGSKGQSETIIQLP